METDQQRLLARIHGRVQGVSFRYFTLRAAERLGLTGWVRNRFDGTVELVAEGEKQILIQFIEIINQGSGMAQVVNIEQRWDQASGEFTKFSISATR